MGKHLKRTKGAGRDREPRKVAVSNHNTNKNPSETLEHGNQIGWSISLWLRAITSVENKMERMKNSSKRNLEPHISSVLN